RRARPGVHAHAGEVAAQERPHARQRGRVEAARLVEGGAQAHVLRLQLAVDAVAALRRAEQARQLAELAVLRSLERVRRLVAERLDLAQVLLAFTQVLVG